MSRVIIYEDTAYKVYEKEYSKLCKMQKESNEADYPDNDRLDEELCCYLDKAILKYEKIGTIDFHHQR